MPSAMVFLQFFKAPDVNVDHHRISYGEFDFAVGISDGFQQVRLQNWQMLRVVTAEGRRFH